MTAGSAPSEPSGLSFTRTLGTGGFGADCSATGTTQHLCSCSCKIPTSESRWLGLRRWALPVVVPSEARWLGLRRWALPVVVPSEAVRLTSRPVAPDDCDGSLEAKSFLMSPAS